MWIDCELYIGDDAMAKLNTKIVMSEGEQGKDGTNIFIYKVSLPINQS